MYDFYSTDAFEKAFYYDGSDLGAVWQKERTIFRVWAPTAQQVSVRLYRTGDPAANDCMDEIPMQYDFRGTWVAEKKGDLNGVYYTYCVQISGNIVEACDPYARTTGVNGQRAMVIDLKRTNPLGWDIPLL